MRVLGITAEYDPFHNGHAYHLKCAREAVCPDVTICVMSGDITQRGELTIQDKWNRARKVSNQGLDLVMELPFVFACSPAAIFAKGAVDILASAGASHIAFGCEAEDPDRLMELAELQISEADSIEEATRIEMKSGASHVRARQKASETILGRELTGLSLEPNNILALEYLKRIIYWKEKGRDIEPVPVLRRGSGYKETGLENMAGGAAIREMIEGGEDVSQFLPYPEKDQGGELPWIDMKSAKEEMLRQLKGMIIRTSPQELAKTRFVGEGLENRLVREITEAETYDDLLRRMTSKRYTTSTIRRVLICMLMGLESSVADGIIEGDDPTYGRILALAEPGRKLIASEPELPFISNVNRTENLSQAAKKSLEIDIRGADLYNLLTGRDLSRSTDHRMKPYVR